ncbi:hypothetical protein MBSD_n0422 [Mizugakiibacter sediminis]|uniref:Uncharacterized protein n=1 Tax=Mizugakiibacter sediminis TaxID=1475481 RepID=A0A0K8QJX4_9GAMM|nr:hypothetical protein [Mizugakiibacter sediminis]GAP65133.1 hypothetical protein MBSD_n0422 [Mizugakiibacter sediminis]
MQAAVRPAADPAARRGALLRALGLTPYRLRAAAPAMQAAAEPAAAASATVPAATRLAVVLPAAVLETPRQRALVDAALAWLGAGADDIAWLPVRNGASIAPPPQLPAYLVFGEAQALGRELPAAAQARATIALADTPAELLAQPARKRELWRALKTLRRALRGDG